MKSIACLIVSCLSLVVAKHESPFQFAACKPRLLETETDIIVRNKDWKEGLFANIVTKSEPKVLCLHSARWAELDTSEKPPVVIFHQTLHYRYDSKKEFAKFSELYQVKPDHYVFKYSHGKETARVHVKWLKLIPGVLEIQYLCSDDFIYAENIKDFVLVMTPSAMFTQTIAALTNDVLHRNHIKLRQLTMVPNCTCAPKKEKAKTKCVNRPLFHYLNK